ncbi:peptide-methionine (S)-S-oxide reductase MsrA [Prolixibacter denitrificans]|uniref:Peptide methionine sulfoxide reductase MsrA n=1 Tax=Prolixibacter denitrificans TaxID=1541063 RepID=A0A2P8CEF1_9BACT|nr:peptide-methionine (S)-S-oxide reductase MsrA [Prolixibacter denitrificans]PSK83353.1 peptide-methionine (S)-S-oxide reductase [Prolixibacter denitrificans]GET21766.1 peptide methionine sulfoxide reductase MsrA [Prolixibacter denitrificans]
MKTSRYILFIPVIVLAGITASFSFPKNGNHSKQPKKKASDMNEKAEYDTATFGEGCFWCSEAIFSELKGVKKAISGYSGGTVKNPSYREVCTGKTGHAECVQVIYNPKSISYPELLKVFWQTHDPTTLNRQGHDVGTQYRSVIFYHNERQKELAEEYKQKLNSAGIWNNPIVTEITKFEAFYPAENYHQDYYENNTNQPYCQLVITPKLEKFRKVFKDKLK